MKGGSVGRTGLLLRPGISAGVFAVLMLVAGGRAQAQAGSPAAGAPDSKVLTIPGGIVSQLRRNPPRGIELIADYLREPGNEELTVRRYHDWLSLNHYLDPNRTVPPGRFPYFLLTEKSGSSEAFARVMGMLLDRAGIENVLIDGVTKRYVGEGGEPLGWMWNAVRLQGRWRLVDASMDAVPSYRKTGGEGPTGSGLAEAPAVSGRSGAGYSGEYLFPDPEGFSFTHFPFDDRFLLAERPRNRREFLERPLFSPGFARFDLVVLTPRGLPLTPTGDVWEPLPWEGIYRSGDRYAAGTDTFEILIRKPGNIEVSALLTDRFGARRRGRVLVHEDGEGAWVEIAPDGPGDYTATLFVRDDSGGEPWSEIYTFSIASDGPAVRSFPRSGLVYRNHAFFARGLGLTAASVPAPSYDPAGCYIRLTLPEGYEADGFLVDTDSGEELYTRVASSYAGMNEVEFRFNPPGAGRYRGGITLMRVRGRSRPETVLEFYLDVWEPGDGGSGTDGGGDSAMSGRPEYPGAAENLLLSRSFHREGLTLEALTGYDPDTGYAVLSVGVPDSFFPEGLLLDCDAVDGRGENADFNAAYHRSSGGYSFYFAPDADRALTGRIILRRRDPETGSFRSEQVAARLTLPRTAADPAPLPPADILAHQNGAYLAGTGVVRENITNRFVEGFVEITLSHPPDAEMFVWYRDEEGTDYSKDSLQVSIPASGQRSFRFRHPRFDPAVARVMIRSGSTGGEFLPAYEFTVLPGLRTADSLPPAGTLHFYPDFSRNGLVLLDEELRVPAGGRYMVRIRTPERYGLIAEVVDGLGRRIDGAVHLQIREDSYTFFFDPPPAGREYRVTLYLTDRFGSRIPVVLFKLS